MKEGYTVQTRIRPYHEDDLADLLELSILAWEPIFASFHHVLGAELDALLHPDWQASQREVVKTTVAESEGVQTFVAEVDGEAVGFIAYQCDEESKRGEIVLLAVHPEHQNENIGTELNELALSRMEAAGMEIAIVETGGDASHAPARRSYEKAGFTLFPIARYFKAL
jgi:ribosomal protein S18 acetylase RimI-like enzyme